MYGALTFYLPFSLLSSHPESVFQLYHWHDNVKHPRSEKKTKYIWKMGSDSKGCQDTLFLSISLAPSLSLSLPLQPFSIISAQTSLLKRAKLKPQFSKLQNSIINAQLSLRLYWVQAWGETNILQLTHAYTHIYMLYASRNTKRSMQRRNCCWVRYYTLQTCAHICHKSTTELHIMRKHANYTHTRTLEGAVIILRLYRPLPLQEPLPASATAAA